MELQQVKQAIRPGRIQVHFGSFWLDWKALGFSFGSFVPMESFLKSNHAAQQTLEDKGQTYAILS